MPTIFRKSGSNLPDFFTAGQAVREERRVDKKADISIDNPNRSRLLTIFCFPKERSSESAWPYCFPTENRKRLSFLKAKLENTYQMVYSNSKMEMRRDRDMDKEKSTKRIVVRESRSWSSSFSRAMGTAGRAASTAAIQLASTNGTQISYLENGVVVRCTPDTGDHK